MSKKPETVFKEKVLADLRALPNCYAEKIQQKSICGTPDIYVCLRGLFIAIELKVDDDVAEPLQEYVLGQVRKAGGIGLVVWKGNWGDVLMMLRTLARAGDDPLHGRERAQGLQALLQATYGARR